MRALPEGKALALDIRIYADEIAAFPLTLRLLVHLHETALFLLREKRIDRRDNAERCNVALRLDVSGEAGVHPRRLDVRAVRKMRGACVRQSAPPRENRDASGDAARQASAAETARAYAADAVLRTDLHDLRNAAVEIGQDAHADGASLAEPQRHVAAVVHGHKIGAAGEKPGTIIVDMSSVAPGTTQKMAKVAAEHGVKYMDAPVSGGTIGAQKGTLTIMCGADEETFEKAKPVLEAIGKRIMRIGGTGMGDAMKIVNNMLLGANMASLAEALVLGAKLGLDNKTMYDVISTSSGNSYVVDAKMKKFIMPDKFEPGFAMDVQYKDLTLAQEAARGVKMPIPMSATCTAVYEQARAAGYGMEDMSAVIKLWEKLMGVEIRGELE